MVLEDQATVVCPLPGGMLASPVSANLGFDFRSSGGLVVLGLEQFSERLLESRSAFVLLIDFVGDFAQNAFLRQFTDELWHFLIGAVEELKRRRNRRFAAYPRCFVAVEHDVLGRMWDLGRLVVVVDQDFFRRLIRWSDVGRECWPVDDNANDLVRFVPKGVGELTEILGVLDG